MSLLGRNHSIANAVFFNFVLVIFVLAVPMGAYWAIQSYRTSSGEIAEFRERFMTSQKTAIRQDVEHILRSIEYQSSQTETRVRDEIQNRVYEAHAIAQGIYNTWHGKVSDQDLERMVREALRPIRFNNGRGYYFATRLDGVEQLFADRPELEQKNLLEMRDTQGKYVIRDMIDLVQRENEGFYTYRWTKPEAPGRDFAKLSFIKRFEPFGWFIGTGEYLDDMEADIRREVLDWLKNIRFRETGYVFVLHYDGDMLCHPLPQIQGTNIFDLENAARTAEIQKLLNLARSGGGFVEYAAPASQDEETKPKLSYVIGFAPWQWAVGTGILLDDLEKIVGKRTALLERRIGRDVQGIVFFVLAAAAIALLISTRFSHNLRHELDVFKTFFRAAGQETAHVDTSELTYSEFQSLARSANRMAFDRRRAEEEQSRLTEIVEQAADGIVILDLEGRIEYVNPAFETISGFLRSDLLGKFYQTLLPTNGIPEGEQVVRAMLATGHPWSGRVTAIRKNGAVYPMELVVSPLRDSAGHTVKVVAMGRDVTHVDKLEEQLRQAQKMEAVGQLAGGIAHDFNNLLQVIQGHVELALDDISPETRVHDDLEQIQTAGKRASGLVRQLLTFSRRETIQPEVLDINDVIGGLAKMIGRLIGEHIELVVEAGPDLRPVYADRGQIEQILVNLCVNARDAMPDGGTLTIATQNTRIDEQALAKKPWARTGEYVLLSVRDTGTGIPSDMLEHLFEPFFTTKEVGRGTGLGLATVYGITKRHEGLIDVKSKTGEGTAFFIYLPVTLYPAETRTPSDPSQSSPPAAGTILVAEDDEQVRKLAVQVLQRAGYHVLVARDGEEATNIFQQQADVIDGVLLDVVMPKKSGQTVYEDIQKIRPGTRVVFATGYSFRELDLPAITDAGVPLIHKPYRPTDLLAQIRETLAS